MGTIAYLLATEFMNITYDGQVIFGILGFYKRIKTPMGNFGKTPVSCCHKEVQFMSKWKIENSSKEQKL